MNDDLNIVLVMTYIGPYIGRFAPSPTGPLHMGSLVAALASWLDARAHNGVWLVRIEDVDHQRCNAVYATEILQQLHALGLVPDEAPCYQTQNFNRYEQTLDTLIQSKHAYPCCCTRAQIIARLDQGGQPHVRHHALIYPGTCRPENGGMKIDPTYPAWRFHLPAHDACHVKWQDRRLGAQTQQVDEMVGDFVLKRADDIWAYQLAVVADDIAQGITDVVRGEDIADNTARQILLYVALGKKLPRYLHVPLVKMPNGEKLSKQHGAPAVDTVHATDVLNEAAQFLGLPASHETHIAAMLNAWIAVWRKFYSAD